MRPLLMLSILWLLCLSPRASWCQDELFDAVPADAAAVVAFDVRPDSPGLSRVWGGRNKHAFEVMQAWLKAGAHQALIEVSRKLDVEKHLTSWLDGRVAGVALAGGEEGAPIPFLVVHVTSAEDAESSLVRIARGAKRKEWTKLFDKDGPGGKLYHVILKEEVMGEPLHLCFAVRNDVVVFALAMEPLETWLTTMRNGEPFGSTSPAKTLRSFPDALCKFYVRVADLAPFAEEFLPPGMPGRSAPEWEQDEEAEAADDDELAEGDEVFLEPEPRPDFFDTVLGSIAYREKGLQYDFMATLADEAPEEMRAAFEKLAKTGPPAKELALAVPRETSVAVQQSSPAEVLSAIGFDITSPEGWAALVSRGGGEQEVEGVDEEQTATPREEELPPLPDAAKPLIEGDVLVCLPSLSRIAPAEEDAPLNPFDFIPVTAVIRRQDGASAAGAFAALRGWLNESSPLRCEALASGQVWAVLPKDAEEAKPLAFVAPKGPYLLLSRGVAEVQKAMSRIDEPGSSLDSHPYYQEVVEALGADAPIMFYLNLLEFLAQGGEVGLRAVDRENPYLRRALELTLEGTRGMGVNYRVLDDGLHAKAFIGMDYDRISDAGSLQALAMVAAMVYGFYADSQAPSQEEADWEDWVPEEGAEEEVALDDPKDCSENLGILADAILAFAAKTGRYPDANRWTEEIEPYLPSPVHLLCPEDEEDHRCSYGYNKALHRLPVQQVANPEATILVFDANGASASPHGLGEVMAFRHFDEAFVSYCDRHLELVAEAPQTRWTPRVH